MSTDTLRERPRHESATLFGNRNWTLLWIGSTLNVFGNRTTLFILPAFAASVTRSAFWTSALLAASLLGQVCTQLWAGAVVDRNDARLILQRASFTLALLSLGLAALVYSRTTPVEVCAIVLMASGACTAFVPTANQKLMKSYVDRSLLPKARGINEARSNAAAMAAPFIGTALYTLSRSAPFIADAATYAVQAVMSFGLEPPSTPGKGKGSVLDGLKYVATTPTVRAVAVFAMISNLSLSMLVPTLLLSSVSGGGRIGLDYAAVGFVEAGAGIAGGLMAGRLIASYRANSIIRWGGLVMLLAAFLIASASSTRFVLIPLAILSLCVPILGSILLGYQAAVTPHERQGRTMSAVLFISLSLSPLGAAAGPWLLRASGAHFSLFAAACILTIAWIIVVRQPALSKLGRVEDW